MVRRDRGIFAYNPDVPSRLFLPELVSLWDTSVDHQRRNRGDRVGRQAQTMPMKGSTHDHRNTGATLHVASFEWVLMFRYTRRMIPAMHTL